MWKRVRINLNRNKHWIITLIVFILAAQFFITLFYDWITGWETQHNATESIDYAALKKYLSNCYSIFFMTDQTSIFFFVTGLLYFKFHKSDHYKTVYFCASALLVFDIFALSHFNWSNIYVEVYGSYKSLLCHLVLPVIAWLLLIWIRGDITLKWREILICSSYLFIFWFVTLVVYYSVTYTNQNGQTVHLMIYKFMDFNKSIITFPAENMVARVFTNWILFALTPLAGIGITLVYKFIYFVDIEWFPIRLGGIFANRRIVW